jgi:hypothetical protein
MTANDLRVLDTLETPEYISGELNEVGELRRHASDLVFTLRKPSTCPRI